MIALPGYGTPASTDKMKTYLGVDVIPVEHSISESLVLVINTFANYGLTRECKCG